MKNIKESVNSNSGASSPPNSQKVTKYTKYNLF